mmetsp:Transcript_1465/g.4087  ORF Transcript_1465/g.4087 Transcript_1465/m.4087 type:complete len:244 (+) Transcript_1465:194-925(+)
MHHNAFGPRGTSLRGRRLEAVIPSPTAPASRNGPSIDSLSQHPQFTIHANPTSKHHSDNATDSWVGHLAACTSTPASAPRRRDAAAAQGRRRRRGKAVAHRESESSAAIMAWGDDRPAWTRPTVRPFRAVLGRRTEASSSVPSVPIAAVRVCPATSPRTDISAGSCTSYRNLTSPAVQLGMMSPICQSNRLPSMYCMKYLNRSDATSALYGLKKYPEDPPTYTKLSRTAAGAVAMSRRASVGS